MKGFQDGVIIIPGEDGEPQYMIRKNGVVKWYKLQELTFGDFVELTEADKAQ